MTTSSITVQVFRMGWESGRRRGEDVSPRTAERILCRMLRRSPSTEEVDMFCNGSVDGANDDRWRANMMSYLPENRQVAFVKQPRVRVR
jgi:hypothetical protein